MTIVRTNCIIFHQCMPPRRQTNISRGCPTRYQMQDEQKVKRIGSPGADLRRSSSSSCCFSELTQSSSDDDSPLPDASEGVGLRLASRGFVPPLRSPAAGDPNLPRLLVRCRFRSWQPHIFLYVSLRCFRVCCDASCAAHPGCGTSPAFQYL